MVRRDTKKDDPGEFINVVLTEEAEEAEGSGCMC